MSFNIESARAILMVILAGIWAAGVWMAANFFPAWAKNTSLDSYRLILAWVAIVVGTILYIIAMKYVLNSFPCLEKNKDSEV